MKYYRFMGREEYEKLLRGEKLENHTEWNTGKGIPVTSKGFCFFDSLVAPEKRLAYAFGAFHELDPICVVFKPGRGVTLKEGYGIYAKPMPNASLLGGLMLNDQNVLKVKEYSIEQYDRKTMRPVAVGRPKHGNGSYEWHILWEPVQLSTI